MEATRSKERLRLVKANLTDEGSFDDAIMGCEGVFHTASPVLGKATFDVTLMVPLNVLRSCKKNPRLRRVVLTSSSSTVRVRDDIDPNIPLDESSWSSVEFCKKFEIWYVLSKTLAEKAAWEFCEQNNIDLVTLLPSFIIGPSLPPDLCSTADDVLGLLKGKTDKFDFHGRMGYVHIDDVALSHILVYEQLSAHGRYLCSSKVLDNNQLVSVLSERYPSLPIPKRFKELDRPSYDFNTLKLEGLGMKFKSIEEMFDDCVTFFKERGLISSI
ncbi:hypothetical protein H5410_019895 [Solanum commersonii]|uniref:Dihydroflavonol 4-reductase n=1 Tax=Solanum commersonii TaxID=4109 RepID=A0A9J5ZCK3_SOLCO|nr:hypothetical protein H5410_019895 [Solanum commersonii]